MGYLDDGLAVAHFGGMDRGKERVERNSLPCHLQSLAFGKPPRVRQCARNLHQPLHSTEVLRGAELRQYIGIPQGALTELLIGHPIRVFRQVLKVFQNLGITSHLSIRTDLESKELPRSLDGLGQGRGG